MHRNFDVLSSTSVFDSWLCLIFEWPRDPNVWFRSSVGSSGKLESWRHGFESRRSLNFSRLLFCNCWWFTVHLWELFLCLYQSFIIQQWKLSAFLQCRGQQKTPVTSHYHNKIVFHFTDAQKLWRTLVHICLWQLIMFNFRVAPWPQSKTEGDSKSYMEQQQKMGTKLTYRPSTLTLIKVTILLKPFLKE